MKNDALRENFRRALNHYISSGIAEQIDYEKFYLYSLIVHSTAIEGSTVTEVEAQLLFDEGITSSKRTMVEQLMNLDMRNAYFFGQDWIKRHPTITVDDLKKLSSKVMARTGSEYNCAGGIFSSADGDLRKLNVTAGRGGKSYMSFLKVPYRLAEFCDALNRKRKNIDASDPIAVYELSFWAHLHLVNIHPWADGNGRMSRLLMNLIQMEFGVVPSKIHRDDKAEYIQALIGAEEREDDGVFIDKMFEIQARHLDEEVNTFLTDTAASVVDKFILSSEICEKWTINAEKASILADIFIGMADKAEFKTSDVAELMGISTTTAKRYIRMLVEYGYIRQEGANKNRRYIPLLH